MNWPIAFAFGAMLCWGVGDFLIQKTTKKIGPIGTLLWITLFSSIILLPLVIRDLGVLSGRQILNLLILGALGFASGAIHLNAMKIGKLAVVEAILSIELPVGILLGIIFFQERLGLWQIALLLMLLLGIILISFDASKLRGRDFLEKGALLAVLSGIFVGIVNFLTAVMARDISPAMSLFLPWLFIGLISLAIIIKGGKFGIFLSSSRPDWKLILWMVIIDLLAWLFFALAVAKKELSITIAITESYVVVAMLLGVMINKEKMGILQKIGAGLAISGSLAMGFLG